MELNVCMMQIEKYDSLVYLMQACVSGNYHKSIIQY